MCGIVGYVGCKPATDFLVSGLKRLEYRGYDSAGVATVNGAIHVRRSLGKLAALEAVLSENPIAGNVGIGHTRWATHGKPSVANAHPHQNEAMDFAVVHNGIIENYIELKNELQASGVIFSSETDTEVIVHLLAANYQGSLIEAMQATVERLLGSFAIAAVSSDAPDTIVAVKKESPLVIGKGADGFLLASDVYAIGEHIDALCYVDDFQFVELKSSSCTVYDRALEPVFINWQEVDHHAVQNELVGYPHYMLKEIFEQPEAIARTIAHTKVALEQLTIDTSIIEAVTIVACGTAYHAGLAANAMLEQMLNHPVRVEVASEFRYRKPIINSHHLVIIISQSGETADSIAALRLAKAEGAQVLAVVNTKGSTIAREADSVLYTQAGIEVAVASTKAYTTQITVLTMLAAYWGGADISAALDKLIHQVQRGLELDGQMMDLAEALKYEQDVYYIGRGVDAVTGMEATLKLKEISYIHAESYPAGELKHGTIALIENGTPIIAIATDSELVEKMKSNIEEVAARGAKVYIFATPACAKAFGAIAQEIMLLPSTPLYFSPIAAIVPLQLLAYHTALIRGCDVDQPRNLAKSVTVE
ncbi:glutamine--fructose-6-phosphate transaminase (isomerizing) [Culicoidibacter larvae]|uniref:Glutamine--fructose-6-phosphate aminotransferase [isomerizing] n=1 Tax=Culicoidibacter larvae TaxID=2579976 RepID=A0A5R8Q9L2_9FIRM|nr:glutamine--fructose-6-phosphate transaminase (isomerizing) [Culicoidibacter larvae]TLG71548.1 glutamine--fructose-6-phosphate transaminase (isomerizing) [Culicoidibacter larvae]